MSEKNDPFMKQTGGALRALREERGFTRERLCERIGLSVRHLSAIELGDKNPSISILFQLIRGMGASADRVVYPELFTEDERFEANRSSCGNLFGQEAKADHRFH